MLRTRPPLGRIPLRACSPFDLHVLSTPPAFVLSQDQTRHTEHICLGPPGDLRRAVMSKACSSVVESSCTTQSAPGFSLRLRHPRPRGRDPSAKRLARFARIPVACAVLLLTLQLSTFCELARRTASRRCPLAEAPPEYIILARGCQGDLARCHGPHITALTSLSLCSLLQAAARLQAEGDVGEGLAIRGRSWEGVRPN